MNKRDAKFYEAMKLLTQRLADEGKIIEAGWASLEAMAMPKDANKLQRREMRMAFFAGAQHLWGSVMTFLEEGDEATDADQRRFEMISHELNAFAAELEARARRENW